MYPNNYYQGQPVMNPYYNQPPLQRYEIIHVTGENGARAFRMLPNSQCLLLDDTNPIVWLAQSDGSGYTQVTPFTISPYQAPAQPAPAGNDFETRLRKVEEMLYGKSDSVNAGKSRRNELSESHDE